MALRVLVISHLPETKFSSRQHLGFLSRLKEYCESYQYVPGAVLVANAGEIKMDALSLYKKYRPDVIVLYDSHAPRGRDSIFGRTYFKNLPCKKVVIEVDFYKKFNDLSWYSDNKFDLVIQRGFYEAKSFADLTVPSVWLPFSADEKEFFPGKAMSQRYNIVGFAGTFKAPVYTTRRKAMDLLKNEKLLRHCAICRTAEGSRSFYPPFLRKVVTALSTNYKRSPAGKTFEIMASKTVLLTTEIADEIALFGDNECYVEYREDCLDVVDRADLILDNLDWAEEVAMNGYNAFKRWHTHSIRISQLYSYLKDLLDGKEIRFCGNDTNI